MTSILSKTIKRLRPHTCIGADAEREAVELLTFITGQNREQIHRADLQLSSKEEKRLEQLIERRLNHEPLAYLLGTACFLGREFLISHEVLIPRPATELITEQLIAAANDKTSTILDIGTGSGCVAISIALSIPSARVVASDNSAAALILANQNAKKFKVAEKIQFQQANLLTGWTAWLPSDNFFHPGHQLIIFANLPYIPEKELNNLAPDVRDFEPRSALIGGTDGLDFYRRLFKQVAAIRKKFTLSIQLYLEALPAQFTVLEQLAQIHQPASTARKIYADSAAQHPVGIILEI
jgi:release factor glutamine methyltransferase